MQHLRYNNRTYVCRAPRKVDGGYYTCDAWNVKSGKAVKGYDTLDGLAHLLLQGHGLTKDCASKDCRLCVDFNKCDIILDKQAHLTYEETIAEEAEEQPETVEQAVRFRGTWFECFSRMSEDERWSEYARYHIPNLHETNAIPAGNGLPGGGSKSKGNKKPMKKTPEYMKMLGA